MARSLVPPVMPGAESDLAPLQAGALASTATLLLSARVAHDEVLGEIDIDRMERVMNTEVDGMRQRGVAIFLQRHNLVDHFTRNSPQAFLLHLRRQTTPERYAKLTAAARRVMYEPGQTVVPNGYVVVVTDAGTVRLIMASWS